MPGDVFANRLPDPVLQQVEDFGDGTISVNDCFKPVSRYFDRIARPEQLIPALNRAMVVLTDPSDCGPVTLSMCQDTQAEAYDYPESFFEEKIWSTRRIRPDEDELAEAVRVLKNAKKPVIIAGGGVLFSEASATLAKFAEAHGIPVVETQGGKSSLPFTHNLNMGAVGVTGTGASNIVCEDADVVLAVGTRLQDFTTGSWALFKNDKKTIIGLNTQVFDATKHRALPLIADARVGLEELSINLGKWAAPAAWTKAAQSGFAAWMKTANTYTDASNVELPSDSQVIGAVQRALGRDISVLCASGGLPGELHKLWQAGPPSSYHMEYGFSCMGYEIAGGIGLKMAQPSPRSCGDGGRRLLPHDEFRTRNLGDARREAHRGAARQPRLRLHQPPAACLGGERFNNLFDYNTVQEVSPDIDFAAHGKSLGAISEKVSSLADLERALKKARSNTRTTFIVIDTDPMKTTDAGGHWWDVAIPEVSTRSQVRAARKNYDKAKAKQRIGN